MTNDNAAAQPGSVPEQCKDRVHLALLSGEQVLPNLESVLYWRERDLLDAVHIYYSEDDSRSRLPAVRLALLLKRIGGLGRHFEVHMDRAPGGRDIQGVRNWLQDRLGQWPDVTWVLNAPGGLKPMSFAFAEFAGESRVRHVTYRERGEGWATIERTADGLVCIPARMTKELIGLDEAHRLVDRLRIADILQTQFAGDEGRFEFEQAEVDGLDLVKLTGLLIEKQWNWAEAFRAAGCDLGQRPLAGFLFERYVGAVLKQFGLSNIAHSMALATADDHLRRQEMDLVVCHGGRVIFLDLKLRDDREGAASGTPPHDQIRVAAETARSFGGLNARMLLLRPTWPADPGMRELASAHRVMLLDGDAMGDFISTLGREFGIESDETLREVEQMLQTQIRNGADVFGRRSPMVRRYVAAEEGAPFLNVELALTRFVEEVHKNWVFVMNGNELCLRITSEGRGEGGFTEVFNRAQEEDQAILHEVSVAAVKTGKSGSARIHFHAKPAAFRKLVRMAWKLFPARVDAKEATEVFRMLRPSVNPPEARTSRPPPSAAPPQGQPRSHANHASGETLMAKRLRQALEGGPRSKGN